MNQRASLSLKVSYSMVVLSTILPFGLAKSGWVGLATGAGTLGIVPFIGPLVFLVLGLYRVYLIARVPRVLDSQPATGIVAVIRATGTFCIYVGVVVAILSWASGPLMRAFIPRGTDSGAEYFVVGLYLALAAGIGILGLLVFEFSRLLAFERHALQTRA